MGRHSAPTTQARGRAARERAARRRAKTTARARQQGSPRPQADGIAETAALGAVAASVTALVVGITGLLPGGANGNESVVMAPTGTGVLRGISSDEPLPYVPPQPYDAEEPRQVAGPDPLLFPTLQLPDVGLPDPVLSTPGSKTIPPRVLAAYQAAARVMYAEKPGCHLTWPILAGIGRIESGHARGGDVDAGGTTITRIVGPALDGTGHFALIRDSDNGKHDGDKVYDRAVGPMQFIPTTWAGSGRDGNGDGKADPNNVADAALASAGYLCAGNADLLDREDLLAAVFRYNHSWEYVSHVLAWAGVYAASDLGTVEGDKAKKKPGKHRKADPTTGPAAPTTAPAAPTTAPSVPAVPAGPSTPDPTTTPSPAVTPDPTPTPDPTTTTPEPTASDPASISGRVFHDVNNDRVDDADEPGIEGVTVRVYGATTGGTAVDLTVPTDAAGRFGISGLAPGTYAVRIGDLPGGLLPLGVLTTVGDILGVDTLDALSVGAGDAVVVGFLTDGH